MNIECHIKEKDNTDKSPVDEKVLLSYLDSLADSEQNLDSLACDEIFAQEIDYTTNYTVKMLQQINDYYKLKKRRLNKTQLIEEILAYENDYANIDKVLQRRKLWFYMEELRKDKFFSDKILF